MAHRGSGAPLVVQLTNGAPLPRCAISIIFSYFIFIFLFYFQEILMAHRGSGVPLVVELLMTHHSHGAPLVTWPLLHPPRGPPFPVQNNNKRK